ncbi:mobile element protein [Microcystis aeruginosa NIES-44]|uniref:Mobile element protein n=1 Tax=Microcystis aeruginosa NIES-44 TaxID=449439 RepID=A0A0A1VPU7_MICAE|nr:mobile element protein [Microcystis aeruginosa NIES-44]
MSDYLQQNFCKSTELVFLKGNCLLKLVIISDFITQSKLLGGSTPQTPRVDSR